MSVAVSSHHPLQRHPTDVAHSHHSPRAGRFSDQPAFTLVEMLIAVAITLVMMTAVVTLFANISESIRSRRATMEMSAQLRNVRNTLQQDLAGHTCPGTTWQRPDSDHGYVELLEGQYNDARPSMLTDGDNDSDKNGNPDELDPTLSTVPTAINGSFVQRDASNNIVGTVSGLGDYDDILMFTSRNEHEPFVGRVPNYTRGGQRFYDRRITSRRGDLVRHGKPAARRKCPRLFRRAWHPHRSIAAPF